MSLNETKTYTVDITLSTENGELPTDSEVERLIIDQMAGELSDITGLACVGVDLLQSPEAEHGD